MSRINTSVCEHPTTADRELIYYKLNLLANFACHMGSKDHYFEYDDDDFFAMYGLLSGIAREIYPEWQKTLKSDPS